MISPEEMSSSSTSLVRVFRWFFTTDGLNSYREAMKQLQHGLEVIRRRLLRKRLESSLKQARNCFLINFSWVGTELTRVRLNQARVGSGLSYWLGVGLTLSCGSSRVRSGQILGCMWVGLTWVGSRSDLLLMTGRVQPGRTCSSSGRVGLCCY